MRGSTFKVNQTTASQKVPEKNLIRTHVDDIVHRGCRVEIRLVSLHCGFNKSRYLHILGDSEDVVNEKHTLIYVINVATFIASTVPVSCPRLLRLEGNVRFSHRNYFLTENFVGPFVGPVHHRSHAPSYPSSRVCQVYAWVFCPVRFPERQLACEKPNPPRSIDVIRYS